MYATYILKCSGSPYSNSLRILQMDLFVYLTKYVHMSVQHIDNINAFHAEKPLADARPASATSKAEDSNQANRKRRRNTMTLSIESEMGMIDTISQNDSGRVGEIAFHDFHHTSRRKNDGGIHMDHGKRARRVSAM